MKVKKHGDAKRNTENSCAPRKSNHFFDREGAKVAKKEGKEVSSLRPSR